jgi:glycosyltransferase involved in cell wall biosynthesis
MVEYITDGRNGFLFDPKSLEELIQKTEQVLSLSEGKMMEMRTLASSTIHELFAPEKYLNELNRIYRLQPKTIA